MAQRPFYYWTTTTYSDDYDQLLFEDEEELIKHFKTLDDDEGRLRADFDFNVVRSQGDGPYMASRHFPRGMHFSTAGSQMLNWTNWWSEDK